MNLRASTKTYRPYWLELTGCFMAMFIGIALLSSPNVFANTNSNENSSEPFQVVGHQIIDPSGNVFVPVGANVGAPVKDSAGAEKWVFRLKGDDITSEANVAAVQAWGWNFLRVNTECLDNPANESNAAAGATETYAALDKVVETYTAIGVVVALDCHSFTGPPEQDSPIDDPKTAEALDWWSETAFRYKENQRVWFAPGNEMSSSGDAIGYIQQHMDARYQRVTAAGAENLMVFPLPGYQQQLQAGLETGVPEWMKSKCNVVWDWHSYGALEGAGGDIRNPDPTAHLAEANRLLDGYEAAGIAVMGGEFGYDWNSERKKSNFSYASERVGAQTMLTVARERGIGTAVWHANGDSGVAMTYGLKKSNDQTFAQPAPSENLSELGEAYWEYSQFRKSVPPTQGPISSGCTRAAGDSPSYPENDCGSDEETKNEQVPQPPVSRAEQTGSDYSEADSADLKTDATEAESKSSDSEPTTPLSEPAMADAAENEPDEPQQEPVSDSSSETVPNPEPASEATANPDPEPTVEPTAESGVDPEVSLPSRQDCYPNEPDNTPPPAATDEVAQGDVPVVIFDTDMGPDIDDAFALELLHGYVDRGLVEIGAVTISRSGFDGATYVDALNTANGRPDIPIGMYSGEVGADYGIFNSVANDYDFDVSEPVEGFKVQRQALVDAAASGREVRMVQVGFSGNISRLLDSPPDEISPLSGIELVTETVSVLSVMGGTPAGTPNASGFNFANDLSSAKNLFAKWPVDMVISYGPVGANLHYPYRFVQELPADHIVRRGYESQGKGGFNWHPRDPDGYYQMMTWDLTSVIEAVKPDADFFGRSNPGKAVLLDGTYVEFTPDPQGRHFTLTDASTYSEERKTQILDEMRTNIN